jgi:chemotaxis protein MotB
MGLSRRRDSSIIWPGFVDAVTTLLMVLMFVLTIFTVMQSVLQETISTQGSELDSLTQQVADLADALGLERTRVGELQTEIGSLRAGLAVAEAEGTRQAGVIDSLTGQLGDATSALGAAQARVVSFEAQVASLLAERDAALGRADRLAATIADLDAAQTKAMTEAEAMQLALARARDEMDTAAEQARLAAARREAVEALLADLRAKSAAELGAVIARLTEAEAARLIDVAAAAALQARLAGASDALTAMTLALEEQRKRAEETLTLLAAAETGAARAARESEQRDAVLAAAERALTGEQQKSLQVAQRVALLNEQIAQLRAQLGSLQAVLDTARTSGAAAQVQLDTLGSQLNAALAQVASEQKRRAELEEAERLRLEAENLNLEKFRSEFFGQLSQLLAGREGVRVVGDRFVFSSEVLFQPGSADLLPEGRGQIAGVVGILDDVRAQIPPGLDWIIRVDGHTDNVPLSGAGAFVDNWQLSQERALSVVRFMQDDLGFPPDRMAATGFGEYRPVATGDTEADRAQNRRIELKLTER